MFVTAFRCFSYSGVFHPGGESLLINLNHALVIKQDPGDSNRCLISFTGYDSQDDDVKYQFISDEYVTIQNHCCFY